MISRLPHLRADPPGEDLSHLAARLLQREAQVRATAQRRVEDDASEDVTSLAYER